MDDIIHVLPDSVANQIAAGEVVQRPSSVVKEMVENSIDAGAQNIQILIVDGGKTNIQIIDDGKGMSETDARLSFDRHATSKINKAEDLFNLSTMGFRGEALASIAAVAQVELKTRREEDELGTFVCISGSKIERQELVACPVGSNFSVQNLFFNIPARRRFLKSNQTELTNVVSEFQRIALVHPDISFTLYNNGVEMYKLPKTSVRQRIVDVFGKKINADLLPLEVETSLVRMSGFVGKPESSKKKGSHQYFFVNGRYMRHPYFHSAVMKSYENLIPVGDHVSYFIYFSVDPSSIDVNVHPTKTEIKFDNEQPIWQVLAAAVKETLGRFSNVPLIDFDVEGKPDIPVMGMTRATIPNQPRVSSSYNPFDNSSSYKSSSKGWDSLYEIAGMTNMGKSEAFHIDGVQASFDDVPISDVSSCEQTHLQPSLWNESDDENNESFNLETHVPRFQFQGRFIITPSKQGVMVVDQRRAHIRILFEQNMRCLKSHRRPSQKVLFPEIVQFDRMELIVLEDIIDDISSLGFELTNLGGGSYSINGTPTGIEGVNVERLLHDFVISAKEKTKDMKSECHEALALTMAKSSAIVYGQVLSSVEMDRLIDDLFSFEQSARTPDGKIIYSVVETKTLESFFI